MAKLRRRNKKKEQKVKNTALNQVPGQVTYVGQKTNQETLLEIFDYDPHKITVQHVNEVEKAFGYKDIENITWINVNGLNNTQEIEKLGKHYNLHPLLIEDIVNTQQRPKIDEYEDYLFIVFKMIHFGPDQEFIREHVSLVMGKNYVLTFQEADGDVFNGLRERIKNAKGRIRNSGADYLTYAILDAVIDNYFLVIESLGEKVELLEESLFVENSSEDITQDIQDMKREIIKMRKAVYPLREVISRMENTQSPLFEPKTFSYIKDLNDHIIQVSENIEVYREMIWGLMDMYMTTISNKMNEVMKVLTIMASIFIPLTFMAGIYGMNFEYIPELQFKYGYFYLWGAMLIVFFMMIWYFRRKKWL